MIRILRAAVVIVLCLCPEELFSQTRVQPLVTSQPLRSSIPVVAQTIDIQPRFYETRWFVALCAFAALGIGASIYALRVRRLVRNELRLTRLVEERTAELRETNAQLEVANEALEELATADALTGVANRRRFDVFLQQEWQRSDRTRLPLSLLLVDVDHFKAYNDTYGHQAGDACLRRVASVLKDAANRVSDLAARYGGEEFAVVLVDTGPDGAATVAEFIRRAVEDLRIPHSAASLGIVTVSIGVCTRSEDRLARVPDLIAACDKALYQAKAMGRNRVNAQC